MAKFPGKMQPFPVLAVSIETSSGPAVDRLLEADYAVYPVQPKAAKAYRTRKAPSGIKDDLLDAWSLAEALRTDGYASRPSSPKMP